MESTLMPLTNSVSTLRQAMDRLIDEAFVGSPWRTIWSENGVPSGSTAMPLNVYATEDQAVILAATPGLKPEDVDVSVVENTVTLSGTIGDHAEGIEGANWYLRELPFGQFRRSVTLPFAVDANQAEATFEHGIVRVVLPKAEDAKPHRIQIQAGSQPQAVGAGNSAN
jgi:HSP20 family protein